MNRGAIIAIVLVSVVAGLAGIWASQQFFSAESLSKRHLEVERATTLPDFAFVSPNGTLASTDLQGRAALINFWATWCEPCRREMPELIKAQQALDPALATIIGIAIDDPEASFAFAQELGVNYPIAAADLISGNRLAQAFGNDRMLLPFSVFVAANGTIDEVILGELTADQILQRLR